MSVLLVIRMCVWLYTDVEKIILKMNKLIYSISNSLLNITPTINGRKIGSEHHHLSLRVWENFIQYIFSWTVEDRHLGYNRRGCWDDSLNLFPLALLIVPFSRETLHWVHSHIQHPLHLLSFPFFIKRVRRIRIHWGRKRKKKASAVANHSILRCIFLIHWNSDMIGPPYHRCAAKAPPGQLNPWRRRFHPARSSTHWRASSSQHKCL